MRGYLEAGLLERLWPELQHRDSLWSGGTHKETADDTFFAFSVSHLMPVFVVGTVGTILRSMVFIADLILYCLHKSR